MANRDHRTGSPREDWNRRAREDYRHAIATYTAGDAMEAEFSASGEIDAREVLALLPGEDTSGWRVLEYGCGVGRLMVPLAHAFEELHGIDISDEMLRIGRERVGERSALHFHVLENGKLPFPDGSFDLVYSVHVFQHMPKPAFEAILPELARMLQPEGRLVFQLTRPYSFRRWSQALLGRDQLSLRNLRWHRDEATETFRRRYYTHPQLRERLARCGLRLVRWSVAASNPRHHYFLARPAATRS